MHDIFRKDTWKTFQAIVHKINVNADANADANANANDAELQMQLPTFFNYKIKGELKKYVLFYFIRWMATRKGVINTCLAIPLHTVYALLMLY